MLVCVSLVEILTCSMNEIIIVIFEDLLSLYTYGQKMQLDAMSFSNHSTDVDLFYFLWTGTSPPHSQALSFILKLTTPEVPYMKVDWFLLIIASLFLNDIGPLCVVKGLTGSLHFVMFVTMGGGCDHLCQRTRLFPFLVDKVS